MEGYRAFLSYSHKDAGWGAKLHRRLEGYKLPKRLAGSETARGVVPERLSPVFRDREELSAGESLSDTIKTALAASDSLIVLCSPNAKASPWVAKEIALFRELHPGRPVLAALIAGEPGEAFPEALIQPILPSAAILPQRGRGTSVAGGGAGAEPSSDGSTDSGAANADLPLHHPSDGPPLPSGEDPLEPIAADFRKSGDGERLALLKLVAGMTGVPLDALVQRDAQRQMRRVTAITGAALAAVLVMALLTIFAFRAQAEAERQRAEAEGLVEYMLTDLRDRLKGVGRLDVMTAVNERAMRYYGGDTLRGRLLNARTLHALGEDESKRGDLQRARSIFTKANGITAVIVRENPKRPDSILAHAKSQYWLGLVDVIDKRPREAQIHLTERRKLAIRARQLGSDISYITEAAEADGDLCANGLDLDPSGRTSLPYCRSALSIASDALAASPRSRDLRVLVANRFAWLADALRVHGDRDAATEARAGQKRHLDILRSRFPEDVVILEYSALYHHALAQYAAEDKNMSQLRVEKAKAAMLYGDILSIEPANAEIKKRMRDLMKLEIRRDRI